MTNREAIEWIKDMLEQNWYIYNCERYHIEALSLAIEALEKQMPKKPKEYEDKYYACPNCGNVTMMKWERYPDRLMDKSNGLPYCLGCGQCLDWEGIE